MKKILFSAILLLFSVHLYAQKLLIDSSAYNKWPLPPGGGISNDGQYLYYALHDNVLQQDSLFVQSNNGKWKKTFLDTKLRFLTQDSKRLVFQRRDSIFLVDLGNNQIEYLTNIDGNLQHLPYGGNEDLLLYKLKGDPNQLIIKKINDIEERKFSAPEKYWYDATTKAFIFLTQDKNYEKQIFHLKYVKLDEHNIIDLWHGPKVNALVFNADGTQSAFLAENNAGERSIWYCDLNNPKPEKLSGNLSAASDSGLRINDILGFNKDNNRVLFTLIDTIKKIPPPPPGVDIYSYKDSKLQSQQLSELKAKGFPRSYMAAINIADGGVLRIEHENVLIGSSDAYRHALPNNWVLLTAQTGQANFHDECNWNKAAQESVYLLRLRDGSKRLILKKQNPYEFCILSPDEKYVIFYAPNRSGYFSFEISTGATHNITHGIHTIWTDLERDDEPSSKFYTPNPSIGGFTSDHRYVLIYDQFDIYKADLTGKTAPVILTQRYGHAHHIVFQVPDAKNQSALNGKIILNAFNKENKDRGFYRIDLDHVTKLDSLTMLPVVMESSVKARDADAYLVLQADAAKYPNEFFSSNLRHFTPITHLHPESKYNWLTSELVTWTLPNGKPCQGILYKPENFDPHKKYPTIIHYYERSSDNLHSFIEPEATNGDINIPLYVSNGYLVFTPDIHYKIGHPGQSAFNAIVSGAKYLVRNRKYIDVKRMGLQGVSFGGFETNYVITHTNMFAAAMADCSMTDFISAYGSIIGGGRSRQEQYELYRDRIGATLWQRPDLYIENTPVLRADRIITPLLLVANDNDQDVPHQQGIELFTALRRLGKKAWMLQYDRGGHAIVDNKGQADYAIRMFQFFNYYLKGELPPKWMTRGVPAAMKGKDDGLALDFRPGATP